MSIYVETRIRGSLDEVWRRTQVPELHERWDLRFTSITYLPRARDADPQRFRYATRVGFGVEIAGWGETVADRTTGGARTSVLKFGSENPWSLIRSGSGYWRYEPVDGAVRFVTGYDYEVRGGAPGRALDRLVFRPLLGWATAWSFDRLRLWIEAGVEPHHAARQTLIHALAAVTVAFVWMWHGLVPKLAGPHVDELALLLGAGVPPAWARPVAQVLGVAEVLVGLVVLCRAGRRWPWLLTIGLMAVATVGVLATAPERALTPFTPVTLNALLAAVAAIGLLSRQDRPSARRCLRAPPRS